MKNFYFPINNIKSKEIYYCIKKRNTNKINSMFFLFKKKIQYVKINKLKKRIMIKKKKNNILNSEIYFIQYKNLKHTLYKVDIKQNIIKLKNKYILKVVKQYILLKRL